MEAEEEVKELGNEYHVEEEEEEEENFDENGRKDRRGMVLKTELNQNL